MKIEQPANLTFNIIKYKFAKRFCLPSKIDFGSDKEWATESSPEFVATQLTNETDC